jgi:hypothetical protein
MYEGELLILLTQIVVVFPNNLLYRPNENEFATGLTSISCLAVAATTGELTALNPAQKVAVRNSSVWQPSKEPHATCHDIISQTSARRCTLHIN